MDVLLIGAGGREDALAWALTRSSDVRLSCAPGNAGIGRRARRIGIAAEDVAAIHDHALESGYDLVVVGPEVPLVSGLADRLRASGVPVFGPSSAAARLEGSKAYSKEFMRRHGIPTAGFRVFSDQDSALRWLRSSEAAYPLVVKADGLAAGKGVVIAKTPEEAGDAAVGMLSGRWFGDAGTTIVVEDCLVGREASFFVLCDGERAVELATCQDYKRALDGDDGPNTGGMGTYSPSSFLNDQIRDRVMRTVVHPTLQGMASDGCPFRGVLFVGLMLCQGEPKVLEYNVRFGDPEAQVLLPRLDGEWLPLLTGCAEGRLPHDEIRWKPEAAVCVVMASGGYPGPYTKGAPVSGLEDVERLGGVLVFHAGTETDGQGRVVTAGGRVLGVTALGPDVPAARRRAYEAVGRIGWTGERHRLDIAADAV